MFEFLDTHLFAFCALVTVGMQLFFFLIAYVCQIDKVTDFAGGVNFIVLAVLTLLLGGFYTSRQWIVTAMVVVSRAELGLFLLTRVLTRGKDDRFDEMRSRFFAFLGFWIFQMIWVFGVSVSLIFLNTTAYDPPLEFRDALGIALFVVGFALQVVADVQKFRFRADPSNKGSFLRTGAWKWSRHPNYFGEMLLWWGVFVSCTPVFDGPSPLGEGYFTIASPVLTMLILLFLSGMTISEHDAVKRYLRPGDPLHFEEYRKQTSPLIPFPPSLYGGMPLVLKRVFFFEWPLWEVSPKEMPVAPPQGI